MIVAGIDPGKQGFITVLTEKTQDFYPMPYKDDQLDFIKLLKVLDPCHRIFIEEPFIMSGNRNKGLKTQLIDFGQLLLCCRLSADTERIPAQNWKKTLALGKDKDASIKLVQELYPNVDLRKSTHPLCKPDHNKAESLLIAHYGLHVLIP